MWIYRWLEHSDKSLIEKVAGAMYAFFFLVILGFLLFMLLMVLL